MKTKYYNQDNAIQNKNRSASHTIAVLWLAAILFISCEDFVEVSLPTSQLTANAVFESQGTADAAMAHVYSKIRSSGLLAGRKTGISSLLGHYTDELTYYGATGNDAFNFYNNTVLPTDASIQSLWNESYSQIYAANAIIAGVESSNTLTAEFKGQLTGEALFIRALIHFYLVNIYGDVPYVTTTDYIVNTSVSRIPAAEVYGRIIEDLDLASNLLPNEDLSGQHIRANSYTAKALLAKAHLYAGNWSEAEDASSSIINDAGFSLETDLNQVFSNIAHSTIWQLMVDIPGNNAEEGSLFIFTAGPPPFTALTENLRSAFEAGDIRKTQWTKEVTDGVTRWFHPWKYRQIGNTGASLEYSVIMRLEEQYLIRAEARARQVNLAGAKEDLNIIRVRAGLNATPAVSQADVLNAILQERRVEFFTEAGHRFFDLKRFNKQDEVLDPLKIGWDANDQLLPIPQAELLLNPALGAQNPGY